VGPGPSGQLIDRWHQDEFTLITSGFQLDELSRVFGYPRIRSKLKAGQSEAFLEELALRAEVLDELPTVTASPDPDDNPILAAALAGHANLVVSGDKAHMVALGQVDGIAIVTPRQALEQLRNLPDTR